MIGWNATFRSFAVVVAGAVVTFCGVKMFTASQGHEVRSVRPSGCHNHRQAIIAAPSTPLVVDVAQFGVMDYDADGEVTFTETNAVKLVPRTSFGWRLHLEDDTTRTHVRMKEVFVLPSAPATWGIGPNTTLNNDLTQATTVERVHLGSTDGWMASAWSVSAGDPPGVYKMMVYLDDQLVKTFEFDVQPPAKKAKKITKKRRAKKSRPMFVEIR